MAHPRDHIVNRRAIVRSACGDKNMVAKREKVIGRFDASIRIDCQNCRAEMYSAPGALADEHGIRCTRCGKLSKAMTADEVLHLRSANVRHLTEVVDNWPGG